MMDIRSWMEEQLPFVWNAICALPKVILEVKVVLIDENDYQSMEISILKHLTDCVPQSKCQLAANCSYSYQPFPPFWHDLRPLKLQVRRKYNINKKCALLYLYVRTIVIYWLQVQHILHPIPWPSLRVLHSTTYIGCAF